MDPSIVGFTIKDQAGLEYAVQVRRSTSGEVKLKCGEYNVRKIGPNTYKVEGTNTTGVKI